MFSFSDTLKSASKEAVAELRSMSMKVWMLTGDDWGNAHSIGSRIGLGSDDIFSNLSPSDKLEQVRTDFNPSKSSECLA
jgi:Cu+-exporting ATPase